MVIKLGKDIIIGQDWLQKNKPTIDWERNTIRLHSMETTKVPAWLENMKEVFEDPQEGELPKRKGEFDHEINLTVDSLPRTPIIPLRPDDQAFSKTTWTPCYEKDTYRLANQVWEHHYFLSLKKTANNQWSTIKN